MPRTTTPLWIGTYPAAGAGTPSGRGEGVWRVDLDPSTGALTGARLAVATPAPSFLAAHPGGRVLYAVAEDADGTVTAHVVDDVGGLAPLAVVASGGSFPCHLLLSPDARSLYVANYGSGTLGVLPLGPDGAFAADVLAAGGPVEVHGHAGAGPRADRQEGPHAHFAALAPGGERLLVCDLGTDTLWRYRIGPDGRLTPDGVAAELPPGTGPRHLAVGPAGPGGDHHLYLAGELDDTVRVLRWDVATATAALVQTLSTTSTPVSAESAGGGGPLPSHVLLDGDRLVLAVRGPDVLVTWPVDPATGLLGAAVEVGAGGAWPRHLAVVAGLAVVADQGSGDLAVVRLPRAGSDAPDTSGGRAGSGGSDGPGAAGEVLGAVRVPAPACVLPVVP